jgi:hypothetical protein
VGVFRTKVGTECAALYEKIFEAFIANARMRAVEDLWLSNCLFNKPAPICALMAAKGKRKAALANERIWCPLCAHDYGLSHLSHSA